jgi:nitrogen regulatory protein P-II 1
MKKIEAIIRHDRLQQVQDALDELGVSGLTVSEVMGCGRQKGYTEQYRGSRANISLLPKLKVESVMQDEVVERALDAIVAAAYSGEIGDGRVFVYECEPTAAKTPPSQSSLSAMTTPTASASACGPAWAARRPPAFSCTAA